MSNEKYLFGLISSTIMGKCNEREIEKLSSISKILPKQIYSCYILYKYYWDDIITPLLTKDKDYQELQKDYLEKQKNQKSPDAIDKAEEAKHNLSKHKNIFFANYIKECSGKNGSGIRSIMNGNRNAFRSMIKVFNEPNGDFRLQRHIETKILPTMDINVYKAIEEIIDLYQKVTPDSERKDNPVFITYSKIQGAPENELDYDSENAEEQESISKFFATAIIESCVHGAKTIKIVDNNKPNVNNTLDLEFTVENTRAEAFDTTISTEKQLNLIISPNPEFIGRDEELKQLDVLLSCEKSRVSLFAPDGIGKTELARQFIKNYQNKFDDFVWVDFDEDWEHTIRNYWIINAKTSSTYEELKKYHIEFLRNLSNDTLLIIDNYPSSTDETTVFNKLLDECNCKILLIGNNKVVAFDSVELNPLDEGALTSIFRYNCCLNLDRFSTSIQKIIKANNYNTLSVILAARATNFYGKNNIRYYLNELISNGDIFSSTSKVFKFSEAEISLLANFCMLSINKISKDFCLDLLKDPYCPSTTIEYHSALENLISKGLIHDNTLFKSNSCHVLSMHPLIYNKLMRISYASIEMFIIPLLDNIINVFNNGNYSETDLGNMLTILENTLKRAKHISNLSAIETSWLFEICSIMKAYEFNFGIELVKAYLGEI